ncbi:MAG TPA: phosphoribosylanthranilate isomerase [Gemmataceae bacterium]|nr:phosphoribosylanthranilate isomerase [Gemmataceae bacterium]
MSALRVKICGVTTTTDAVLAADLGADAIGLNFYPKSPRFVPPVTGEVIVRVLPPFVEPVALFVNEPLETAFAAARQLGRVRTVQWHGEQPEVCTDPNFRFIPAFQVRDADDLARVRHYLALCEQVGHPPAAVLIDGQVSGRYGGTGQLAPWKLLAEFRPEVPLILAGGLTPENVAEAVRLVRPYGVDVASGVEETPRRKDPEKILRFIDAAREAAARLT